MMQVVQARCPHCQTVLRIPTEWVAKPMRCKHCQKVFQTKSPSAVPAKPPNAIPAGITARPNAIPVGVSARPSAIPLNQPARASSGFSFDGTAAAGALLPPRTRRRGSWLKMLLIFAILGGTGGAVAFFAGPQIVDLFASKDKNADKDKDKARDKVIVANADNPKTKGDDKKLPEDKLDPNKDKGNPDRDKITTDKTNKDKTLTTDKSSIDKFFKPKDKDKQPVFDPKIFDPQPKDPNKDKIKPTPSKDKTTPKDKSNPEKDKTTVVKKDPPKPLEVEVYPRRALLISVNNYLFANSLRYGSSGAGGGSTRYLADLLTRRPMHIPANQVAELTDAGSSTIVPIKPIIENAIVDLVSTARAQDRVILLFAGHVVDIEKDSFLVPLEGELDNGKTLIPLKWVFGQLSKCKAQEKLLVLDVCRFSPSRGFDLPGGGEPGAGTMTEDLDTRLQQPPAGVQIWVSCTKGQHSLEQDDRGSIFLQALCSSLQEGPHPLTEANYPLPLEALVPKVNQKIKDMIGKAEQVSRLTGDKGKEGTYDPKEALPPDLKLRNVVAAAAEKETVDDLISEISRIKPARSGRSFPSFLPPMTDLTLEPYKKDFKVFPKSKDLDPEKQPVRHAVALAIETLDETANISFPETLVGGSGPVDKKTKDFFLRNQQAPAQAIFKMEGVMPKILAAAEKLDDEPSKYWKAQYYYSLARFQSRLVFVYEYNFIMAQVRGDSLPDLTDKDKGWRVASRQKVSISEPKVKDMVKNINKIWKAVAEQNPETPWAVLAKRERMLALGLEWKAWPR